MTHAGESEVRRRAGEMLAGQRNEAVYRPAVHDSGLAFLASRPELWLAAPDRQQQLWVHRLVGEPGWLGGSTALQLELQPQFGSEEVADGSWGLLAIDFSTRRRFRVNGEGRGSATTLSLQVHQAYANCPSYITPQPMAAAGSQVTPFRDWLPEVARSLQQTGALLLASRAPDGGADCSHRGGPPGFAQLTPDGVVRLPDYPGNSLFNTWGNLLLDPQGALAWVDPESAALLQARGRFQLLWDQPDSPTGRVLQFQLQEGRLTR